MTTRPAVAVIGAGIYGCMTALELASSSFKVDLVDIQPGILMGASRSNQGRLHLGYHYPRSPVTVAAAKVGSALFHQRYADCLETGKHYYAVAYDSRVPYRDYVEACRFNGLPVMEADPSLALSRISGCLWAPEAFIDIDKLRQRLTEQLVAAGIGFPKRERESFYDLLVDATYGRLGNQQLQFELTEVVVATLPGWFQRRSIVVMDGDFGVSVDPVPGRPGYHHLYHVTASVHERSDSFPALSGVHGSYTELVDAGQVPVPAITAFKEIVAGGSEFIRDLRQARYVGSLFTVRAVEPNVEDTDARLSRVQQIDDKLIRVFGGKLGDSIATAQQTATLAREICQLPQEEPAGSL